MTPRLHWICALAPLALTPSCGGPSEPEPDTTESTQSTQSTSATVTHSGGTASSSSSSTTLPTSTETSLQDSAVRSPPTMDTGRTDTGWFTLPGPGLDSASSSDFLDSQDTG